MYIPGAHVVVKVTFLSDELAAVEFSLSVSSTLVLDKRASWSPLLSLFFLLFSSLSTTATHQFLPSPPTTTYNKTTFARLSTLIHNTLTQHSSTLTHTQQQQND